MFQTAVPETAPPNPAERFGHWSLGILELFGIWCSEFSNSLAEFSRGVFMILPVMILPFSAGKNERWQNDGGKMMRKHAAFRLYFP
jgi:hypothetical protein